MSSDIRMWYENTQRRTYRHTHEGVTLEATERLAALLLLPLLVKRLCCYHLWRKTNTRRQNVNGIHSYHSCQHTGETLPVAIGMQPVSKRRTRKNNAPWNVCECSEINPSKMWHTDHHHNNTEHKQKETNKKPTAIQNKSQPLFQPPHPLHEDVMTDDHQSVWPSQHTLTPKLNTA